MWYTKDYKLVKKSDPGRRRSLAPAFVLFYRRCLTTNSIANRMPRLLAMLFVLLGLFCAAALPAHAEDYDTVLDRLSRLQALAREYSANQTDTPDPIELTLAYTRTGEYNTTIWQLTAGVRDAGFESYVNSSDPDAGVAAEYEHRRPAQRREHRLWASAGVDEPCLQRHTHHGQLGRRL